MSIEHLINLSIVSSVCWSVFCRARRMDASTPRRLKVQHGLVLVLSLLSLPLFGFGAWGDQLLGLALCVYLWIDARRWRSGPPLGCPVEIHPSELHQVQGGRKP